MPSMLSMLSFPSLGPVPQAGMGPRLWRSGRANGPFYLSLGQRPRHPGSRASRPLRDAVEPALPARSPTGPLVTC